MRYLMITEDPDLLVTMQKIARKYKAEYLDTKNGRRTSYTGVLYENTLDEKFLVWGYASQITVKHLP